MSWSICWESLLNTLSLHDVIFCMLYVFIFTQCLSFLLIELAFWLILSQHTATVLSCGSISASDVILCSFVCKSLLSWYVLHFTDCVFPGILWIRALSALVFVCTSAYVLCSFYWHIPLSHHWLACQSHHLATAGFCLGYFISWVLLCRYWVWLMWQAVLVLMWPVFILQILYDTLWSLDPCFTTKHASRHVYSLCTAMMGIMVKSLYFNFISIRLPLLIGIIISIIKIA